MQKQTNVKLTSQRSVSLRGKRDGATSAPQKLKLLVTIVGRSKAEFYMDLLQSLDVNIQLSMLGHGTANTQMLYLLGLSDSDKAIIFSVVREDRAKEALALLGQKFQTVRGGKGIAYTIPMSSVVGVAIYRFLSDNRMPVKEGL